ncbi:MAG: hypothetical protein P8R42_00915 [Candidatus Binatia bacterium]|nr:hypothetical protein [Candidatus Binatia bacterium]
MLDWKTIVETLAFDTTLGEAFGPYAALAFLGLAATLIGVTLGVMVRNAFEQVRGPETRERAAAVPYPLTEDDTARPPAAGVG